MSNAAFLAAKALVAGDSAVLFATQSHLKQIREHLFSIGLDPHRLRLSRRFSDIGADQALPLIMTCNSPDPAKFNQVVGATITSAAEASASGFVFVFGELVDLLCAIGNPVAAVRLEQLWNDFGQQYDFSLYCAYSLNSLGNRPDPDTLTAICAEHRLTIAMETPL